MASSQFIVVDDTDSRITYSGQGWFQDLGSLDEIGNNGPTYNRTSHGTNNNDSFIFPFEGTSISLIGTTLHATVGDDTSWDPGFECFVDDRSIGFTASEDFRGNHQLLCSADVDDGTHTFSVKVTTTGSIFWVDYLLFTPSPQVSYDEAVLRVDPVDSRVVLDDGWKQFSTREKGSQAKFDFVGKSVTWVGILRALPIDNPSSPASASFSIDGGPPTSFQLDDLPGDDPAPLPNKPFFTTPELAPGFHSLTVIYDGADMPATPLTLAYLYVTNTSIREPQKAATSASTLHSIQSTPVDSSTRSSASTTSASGAVGSNAQGHSVSVSIIVGAVVGTLALATLILSLILWKRRRSRRNFMQYKTDLTDLGEIGRGVTPFTSVVPSAFQSFRTPLAKADDIPHIHTIGAVSPSMSRNHGHNPSSSQRRVMQSRLHARLNIRPGPNQDSGLRFPSARANTSVEDIPPAYTAA